MDRYSLYIAYMLILLVYCWVYPLFTMVYSWDLVPWWVTSPSRGPRMICGSRDTWGAPHMSRVPTAVMFLGATWHLLRWLGSEEFRRSWDILDCHRCQSPVSVTSGTSVVFLVPRYSIQGGSSSRGAESCSRPVAPRWRHVWGPAFWHDILVHLATQLGNVATGTYPKATSVQICIQHHPTSRTTWP
jgi:hypothetical protein